VALEPGFALWIFRSLRRIMRAVDVHSHRLLTEHKITSPQLLCLRTLVDDGPLTAGALAKLVHLSPSTVVGIVDRLEQKSLAGRERSQVDRRQVLVYVTATGVDLVRSIPSPLQYRMAEGLAEMPDAELLTIGRSLEKLVALLELEPSERVAPLLDIAPIPESETNPELPIHDGEDHA